MKVRQIKRNVNRKKPTKFTFGASVCLDGVWQRIKKTYWTRTSDYKVFVANAAGKKIMVVDMARLRKAKPLSLKGL